MRGKAVARALIGEKLFESDIDARVRKVSPPQSTHYNFLRKYVLQILELLKRAYASGIPFDGPEEGVDTPELRALLRTAAADATVLLKNSKSVLPLQTSGLKKIAVIGPNAKIAMTSGGGSARLLSSWTVSPLEGITAAAKEIGAEVSYTIGATSHRYLPLLDPLINTASGDPGAIIEFWNEEPTKSFLDTKFDTSKIPQSDWSTPTLGSNCFLMDGIVRNFFPTRWTFLTPVKPPRMTPKSTRSAGSA